MSNTTKISALKMSLKDCVIIFLILLSGLAIRFLFYKSIDGPIVTSDTSTYIDGAMSLYYHLGFNEYRPPVYPFGLMVLGVLFWWKNVNFNIVLLQLVLSMINIFFIYKLVYEAFQKKLLAYFTAFVVAINFRVYCWDFVVLTENFSILFVTLITYYLVMYLKYKEARYMKNMFIWVFAAIFTKPFFLILPLILLVILIINIMINKHANGRVIDLKRAARTFFAGFTAIYITVFAYCAINYRENLFFGFTSVGNVNIFGKILQYNMENLGSNEELISDIRYAFSVEKPEYKVNDSYLEPWNFIGKYGWTKDHYQNVGKFANEIIFHHPVRYVLESTKLTYRLFVLDSPFNDFIADKALVDANHPDTLMLGVRKVTEMVDSLYILLVVCFLEVIYLLLFRNKQQLTQDGLMTFSVFSVVLYHYLISAFLSYGDYCRLLVPCYPLVYIIICLYIYRFGAFIVSFPKRLGSLFKAVR